MIRNRLHVVVAAALVMTALGARAADPELDALVTQATAEKGDGNARIRARVSSRATPAETPRVLQVLIQTRRDEAAGSQEWTYDVLWPKDLAGWSQTIRRAKDGSLHVTRREAGAPPRELKGSEANLLPGVSMTLTDVVEDIRDWPQRTRLADETVEGRACAVATFAKAAGGAKLKAWIAKKEAIVMRLEYLDASGKPTRRISKNRLVKLDKGWVAGGLKVEDLATGAVSEIEFSRGNDSARRPAATPAASKP